MSRSGARLLVIALVAGMLAGCGSSSDRAPRLAVSALETTAPAPTLSPSQSRAERCGVVTASLRPPAVLPGPGAMPAGSFMARIEHRGYLVAGVDQNTLLFAYFNPLNHQLQGFEIDMLRELARAIFGSPNDIEFKAVTTAERIPAVQNGSVDIVADAMTITRPQHQGPRRQAGVRDARIDVDRDAPRPRSPPCPVSRSAADRLPRRDAAGIG
jgi:polar amino acid transport system substrate-binding protein